MLEEEDYCLITSYGLGIHDLNVLSFEVAKFYFQFEKLLFVDLLNLHSVVSHWISVEINIDGTLAMNFINNCKTKTFTSMAGFFYD